MKKLTARELATTLVALRVIQDHYHLIDQAKFADHFTYPSGRRFEPLDVNAIDDLCEKLNSQDPEPKPRKRPVPAWGLSKRDRPSEVN